MCSDNKFRELITVVAFQVPLLGSYTPTPVPSRPFKTILELVLWHGLQSCRRITHDVINVIKMPSFKFFLYLRQQTSHWGLGSANSYLFTC
jgi:hypothetical protein